MRIEIHPVDNLNGQHQAIFCLQVQAEKFRAPAARHRFNRRQLPCPLLTQHILQLQLAILAFGHIKAQPFGKRGIQIVNFPAWQCREKTSRRMVKVGNDELQAAKRLFLLGAVHAHILQPPQDIAALGLGSDGRDTYFEPFRRIRLCPGC